MKICRNVRSALLLGASWLLITGAIFAHSAQAPDNTRSNRGANSKTGVTADKQNTNSADEDITRQIRRAIVNDKSLSTYAHNVKIITQNGAVTLKGPVRSEEEKSTIAEKAAAVAGAARVTNEL